MNAVVTALEGSRHETQISPKSEAASSPGPGAFDIGNGDKTIEVGDGRGLRAGARELDMEWCPWRDRARDRSGRPRTRRAAFARPGIHRLAVTATPLAAAAVPRNLRRDTALS